MKRAIAMLLCCVLSHSVLAQRFERAPIDTYRPPIDSYRAPIETYQPSEIYSPPIENTAPVELEREPTATINVPTCRQPEDCPDRSAEQRAREKFAACVEKSRRSDGLLDRESLEDCVLGIFSPNKLASFRQCLARNESAWDCYRQAYR
jgi:hypothetical protein